MSDLAKKEQMKFRLDKCTWEKNNLNFTYKLLLWADYYQAG